jgi:hypothetical protein
LIVRAVLDIADMVANDKTVVVVVFPPIDTNGFPSVYAVLKF